MPPQQSPKCTLSPTLAVAQEQKDKTHWSPARPEMLINRIWIYGTRPATVRIEGLGTALPSFKGKITVDEVLVINNRMVFVFEFQNNTRNIRIMETFESNHTI